MVNRSEEDQEPVFHERPDLLATQGYRGFSVSKREKHWEGVKITVSGRGGKSATATGSTEHEALRKLIAQIDMMLDDR